MSDHEHQSNEGDKPQNDEDQVLPQPKDIRDPQDKDFQMPPAQLDHEPIHLPPAQPDLKALLSQEVEAFCIRLSQLEDDSA